MPRRADTDSRSKRKRSDKSGTARLETERGNGRNRSKKATGSRIDAGEGSQEVRFAKQLRGKFFNRQGPADLIVVLALRRPMITSQTDKIWQVEKFVADYDNSVLIDGKGLPEDAFDAIKSSLEGQDNKSIAESAEQIVDGLNRAAPKVKSILEILGIGVKKGSET